MYLWRTHFRNLSHQLGSPTAPCCLLQRHGRGGGGVLENVGSTPGSKAKVGDVLDTISKVLCPSSSSQALPFPGEMGIRFFFFNLHSKCESIERHSNENHHGHRWTYVITNTFIHMGGRMLPSLGSSWIDSSIYRFTL